jgi:membrane-bound lytic murein transglycosylase A
LPGRRRRVRHSFPLLLIFLIALVFGMAWWFLTPTAPPPTGGALRLTKVAFDDLPGWRGNDARAALAAFARSCAAFKTKAADKSLGGAGYAGNSGDWSAVCAAIPANANAALARAFFEKTFAPFRASAGDNDDGTFTGYYEPELRGSRTKHGAYQTPVYGVPGDLVSVDLGLFHIDVTNKTIAGFLRGAKLMPYPTRGDIDAHGLPSAKILFYADDPIDVFFLHIQGSGRVELDDGAFVRVAYAGQNGRPYTAIGRTLMARGVPKDGMSMQVIRAWLKTHPNDARTVMESDQSFVFFQEQPVGDASAGAEGAQGVALTPEASLAVDLHIHALGVPVFVDAGAPDADPNKSEHPFQRLMVAQDTGGAIRGAVRGDVFWGYGARAEAIAGRMKFTGRLYVLLPKMVAARLGETRDFAGTAR